MVVTAFADVDPILRAINDGLVVRYIIKPWVRTELVQVLRWATEAWTFGRDSAALHKRLFEIERLATLGSIIGMVAQDLRQPLASLVANLAHVSELANAAPTIRLALEQTQLEQLIASRWGQTFRRSPVGLDRLQSRNVAPR